MEERLTIFMTLLAVLVAIGIMRIIWDMLRTYVLRRHGTNARQSFKLIRNMIMT